MSGLDTALLINGIVLAVVLEADLGPHRKISWFRVARPIVTAGLIVPFYLAGVATSGTGLLVEVAATVAGLLLGLAAGSLFTVYRSPKTGKPVSHAGLSYAALWAVVIGARVAFSYGSTNWFGPQLNRWLTTNSVSVDAVTDSLIFMAIAMLVARTLSLAARAMTVAPVGRDAVGTVSVGAVRR